MNSPISALIFDLDGTITDSKPGIVDCLRKVLDARKIEYLGPLERFVGPPVEAWTRELLPEGTSAERAELGSEYRACYDREGWSNNSVYPGVRPMLSQLHDQGIPLFICTSKQLHFAQRILEHFGLSDLFEGISGDHPELMDHRKAALLAGLMRENSLSPQGAWMVGDRIFDIEAAHANGMRCLAAAWGYGPAEECAQADAIVARPMDVLAWVTAVQEG